MNEFDILIGVDMSDAESKIKDSLKNIGDKYPVEVNLVIKNESEFIKDIQSIKKLLGNLEKIDVNIGLDKELKDAKSEAQKLANELVNNMNKAKQSADSYNNELEEGNRLLKEQIRLSKDNNGNDKEVRKKTTGTPNNRKTETFVNGTRQNEEVYDINHEKERTDQLRIQKMIQDQHFKNEQRILSLEREGVAHTASIGKLKRLNGELLKLELNDLTKIEKKLEEIAQQHTNINNKIADKKFEKAKSDAYKGVESKVNKKLDSNLLGEDMAVMDKRLDAIANAKNYVFLESAIKNATNAYDELLRKQGNMNEVAKMQKSITNDRVRDLENEAKELNRQMNERAKVVQKHLDDEAKFIEERNQAEAKEARAKADAESKKLEQDAKKLTESREKHYKEQEALMMKQYDDEEKMKKAMAQRNLKRAEDEAKEVNRLHNIKAQQVQNAIDSEKAFRDKRDKEAEKEAQARVNKETKELEDMKKARDKHVADQRKAEQELANQMGGFSEKSQSDRKKREKDLDDAQYKAIAKEAERVNQNQLKINEETEKWNQKIKEIKALGFVDESDLIRARQLISGLSKESDKLEQELREVKNALNQVNSLSNSRSQMKDKLKTNNSSNNARLAELERQGNIPQSMMNNFKSLNGMLDFKSDAEDIRIVNQELKRMEDLNKDIIQARKQNKQYDDKIASAMQQQTKALDRQLKSIDNIQYSNNQNVLSAERKAQILEEEAQLQQRIASLSGKLTESQRTEKVHAESQLRAIKDMLSNDQKRLALQQKLNSLQNALKNHQESGKNLSYQASQNIQRNITNLQRQLQTQKSIEASLQNEARIREQLRRTVASDTYRAGRGLDNNPDERNEINRQAESIRNQLNNLNNVTGDDFFRQEREIRNSMDRMNQDAQRFRNEIRDASNSITGQLGNAMKKVPIWMGAMGLFFGALNQVQMGFQGLLDFDTAMTNLQKVTEASTAELKEFKDTAHNLGLDLGVTATDVVNATAEFQKIGFNLQESAQLGKSSLLYANVGDMSVEDAQKNMISAVKGFNIEVDASGREVTRLVDIFNEVGNNYAITSAGIGEALRRSSAVLSEAGNSVEESVALVTAANTTIQDPERVGTALKTVSMRLRGVNEEGKVVKELVPEIESSLETINMKLGLVGEEALTLKKDENTFLSTFEMFGKIAKQWDNLTDMERANLVEQIGGKEQGAIVASMINNWTDATNSYETALNSAGSAQKEFNNYTQSFDYKIGRLKSAMEGFWQALINDDAVKGAIDGLTSIVGLMTKLASMEAYGATPMIAQLTALIAFLASPKLRMAVLGMSTVSATLTNVAGVIAKVASRIPQLMAFMVIAYGIGKAMEGLYNIVTLDSRQRKERINVLQDEITALEELKSANEELDKTYGSDESFGSGVSEFDKLRNKGSDRTVEEDVQFEEMSKKIEDTMPQFIAYYDEYGNAVFKSTEEMKNLNSELEKNLALKEKTLLKENVADTDFEDLQKEVDEARKIFEDNQKYLGYSEEYSQSKEWIENEMKNVEEGTKEYKEKVKEFVNSFPEEMQNISYTNQIRNALLYKGKDEGLKQVDSVIKQVKEANSSLAKELDKAKSDISLVADDYKTYLGTAFSTALFEADIKPNTNEYLLAEKLQTYLADNIEMFNQDDITKLLNPDKISEILEDVIADLDKVDLSVDDLFNVDSGNAEETAKSIQKVINKLSGEGGSNTSWFIDILKTVRMEHLKTANQLNNTPMRTDFNFGQEVLPIIDNLQSEISQLDSAYRTLAEGQQLSNSEIFNLIKQYPQLNKHLQIHNGQLRISGDAIKALAKVKEQQAKQDLAVAKQKAITAKAEAEATVKSVLTQIKSLNLLGQAQSKVAKVDQQTKNALAKKASEMFNAGYREQGAELMKQANQMQGAVNTIANLDAEISAINALMGADYSSNLGSLNNTKAIGGSSAKDKDSGGSKDSKQELQDAIYVADVYSQKINALNQLIERQQLLRERMVSGSAEYNKTINEEVGLLTQKKNAIDNEVNSLEKQIKQKKITQYGLITVGQEDNSTARKKNAELQQEIDEAKERLAELRTESYQVFNEIKEVRFAYIESVLESYERQREQWEDDIAYTEYSMSLYAEKTDEFRKAMKEQEGYMKKQLAIHETELNYLETQKKTHKELTAFQREELNSLIRDRREAIYSLKEELQEFNMMMIESKQSVFSSDREQWTDDIEYTEYMMDLFLESSEGYRKWSSEKEGMIRKQLELQQEELKMLEKEKKINTTLTNAQRDELNALIREAREEVYGLSSDLIGIQADIAKSRLDEALHYMETESTAYAYKIEEINNKMRYEVDEEEYYKEAEYLQQIIALRKGEIADIQENIAKLKTLHEENIDNVHIAEQISDEIKNWERNLINAQNAMADVSINIKNIYKQLANEYVDLYKKQLELMKKADEEYYDGKLEAEAKAHESRMNQIEREISIMEKAYEIANKAIDRESSTKTYNDEMKKLETEALELKKQIDILSLDDSYEAKKKKSELVKKLTETEMQMADKQYDRTIDLRKQNLEDDLDTEKEMMENKKSALEEEYDIWVEKMEEKKEKQLEYWDEELNNERKFAQMREEIMSGNLDNIVDIMKKWVVDVEENMKLVGDSVEDNFIYQIEQAIEKFKELQSMGGLTNTINNSGTTNLNGEGVNQNQTGSKTDNSTVKQDGSNYITPETETKQNQNRGQLKSGVFASKEQAEWLANNATSTYGALQATVKREGDESYRVYALFEDLDRAKKVLADMIKLNKVGVGYTEVFDSTVRTLGAESGNYIPKKGKLTTGTYEHKATADAIAKNLKNTYKADSSSVIQDGKYYRAVGNFETVTRANKVLEDMKKLGKLSTGYISAFDTGGYTGDWGNNDGKLAFLHKKELVLNAEQTKDILNTAKIVESLKTVLPKLNMLTPKVEKQAENGVSNTTNNSYNLTLEIDNMNGNKKDAERVSEQIINNLKRTKGGRF